MFYWKFSHFIFRENFAFFRGETDKIEIRRKKLFAKLSTLFAGNYIEVSKPGLQYDGLCFGVDKGTSMVQ